MPTSRASPPMPAAIQSICENRFVIMRAMVGGLTSAAEMSVTPSTFMLVRIAKLSSSINSASTRATLAPDADATSGSNVVKERTRFRRLEQRAVAPLRWSWRATQMLALLSMLVRD